MGKWVIRQGKKFYKTGKLLLSRKEYGTASLRWMLHEQKKR